MINKRKNEMRKKKIEEDDDDYTLLFTVLCVMGFFIIPLSQAYTPDRDGVC